MKRLILLLCTVCITALLMLPVAAEGAAEAVEVQPASAELEALMEQFRADYGLNEQNFSLCYYNTVTGEEYRYNDETFFVAASTFKLPLNLYYYEMEDAGEISSDAYIGGMTLSDAHYQSLVWSNNEVSIAMLYNLGNFRTYKDCMRKYFTMDESAITSEYYADNNYCTSMMLDTLKYLYAGRDQFEEMIGYMLEAQPGEYFDRYMDDVDVAHKYGYFVDDDKGVTAINDTGIIYTSEPFLLAVYTSNAPYGAEVVSQACRTLADYTEAGYEARQQALEEQKALEEQQRLEEEQRLKEQQELEAQKEREEQERLEAQQAQEEQAQVEEPAPEEVVSEERSGVNIWWIVLGAAVVFLVVDLVILCRMAKKRRKSSR